MIWYILVIIVILILIKNIKYKSRIDGTCFIQHNVLTRSECNNIIDIASKYEFKKEIEMVDGKPEYQIDILDEGVQNEELWKMCKKIYTEKLKPILNSEKWLKMRNNKLDFIFLKKYSPTERSHIPLHLDDNHLTMSFLLSDTRNFKGGELYIFDTNESNKLDMNLTVKERDRFVNSYKNLPIVPYSQGDVSVYTGGIHAHGILPVTKGERYILTFFFF